MRYICVIMSRKMHILNVLISFIYLWVIATLPIHYHDRIIQDSKGHTCEHKHQTQHSDDENCIICFNLFVPQAIDYIDISVHIVQVIEYYTIYKTIKPQDWQNVEKILNLNKDPPTTFIS